MTIRILFFAAFLFILPLSLHSQCIVDVNGLPCVNNPIEFESKTPGASMHSWNFNNEGFNNTSGKPTFIFSTLGAKLITYSCMLPNGSRCTTTLTVTIKGIPKLRLNLLGNAVQCYENNLFCIRDSSLSGDSDYCIKAVKYLFSDQELITKYGSKNNPVKLPSTICKSYVDPQGGDYKLLVEIEDCNGCMVQQELPFTMKVELLPPIFADATIEQGPCDGEKKVKFINLSQINKSVVTKFIWDFGDGSKDSLSWDSVLHTYTSGTEMSKTFNPKLVIHTGNGCTREFFLKPITVFNINPFITADRDSICVGETVNFELHPSGMQQLIGNEDVRWDFDPGLANGYKVFNNFGHVGPNLVTCIMQHPCGPFVLRDTIVVIGPKAVIEPDLIDQNERYQCHAKDTVHVADHSLFYHNDEDFLDDDSLFSSQAGNLKYRLRLDPITGKVFSLKPYNYRRADTNVDRLWDFDDPYCPPCTSDRKKNINVGLNCRYAKDSMERHFYTSWDSVYNYGYYKGFLRLPYFDPVLMSCNERRVWADDSLYAVTDSLLYFGDNSLGLSAKDSVVFQKVVHNKKLSSGLNGKATMDLYFPLRIYIPINNSIVLDKKDGSPQLLINGPQFYNVESGSRIITDADDTCLFVFGLKVFYDTLAFENIRSYHLSPKKVAIPGYNISDSINKDLHRRLYFEQTPRCFNITLTRQDTIHPMGCVNVASSAIALMPPSPKNLSISDHYCYGYDYKILELNLSDTKPGCMSSFVQFNPDYIRYPNNWLLLNNLTYGEMQRNIFPFPDGPYRGYAAEGPNHGRFFWVYNDTALPNKNIQHINPALIIGNGIDPNFCVDTFYYKDFASFPRLSADLVFASNGKTTEHVCSDTFLYVTIPEHTPDANALAHQSSWLIIENNTGDTLERIDETYFRIIEHWLYPSQKVNYTVIERYKWQNNIQTLIKTDTLITAIVHQFKPYALPGLGLNILKRNIAALGFEYDDFNDTNILDLIWNRTGTIGQPLSGSKGCVDTTGFGYLIKIMHRVISSTLLHYKDSSLYPADIFTLRNIDKKAYAFRVKRNGSYNIHRNVNSIFPGYCGLDELITAAVGFQAKVYFSDTIICAGRSIEGVPDFRYFSLDSGAGGSLDSNKYWFTRQHQAGSFNREGVTIWDYSLEDDDKNNPATIFGSFPYVKKGYGLPGILLGNDPLGFYYKTPGIYTMRVLASDSNGCKDTIKQKIYVSKPEAGFYTDVVVPNCVTILELFDTSFIDDPCAKEGKSPCDNIYKWTINWGDGNPDAEYFKALPKQIGHNYNRTGFFKLTLIIESVLGCRDTAVKDVFIPGPGPLFNPETSIRICVGDSVRFRNKSKNFSSSSDWLWNFGDGYYSPQKDTTEIYHRYMKTGSFDVYLNQSDSIANTGKYCPAIYPDLQRGDQKITVLVIPYDTVDLIASPIVVCVGDTLRINADLRTENHYLHYNWTNNGSVIQNDLLEYAFSPSKKGKYRIAWEADTIGLNNAYCPDFDSITVYADSVMADFTIDESNKPIYCFSNQSMWANEYRWGFFHDTDITFKKLEFKSDISLKEPDRDICQNFIEHGGVNWICLEAINNFGCKDTFCQKIDNDYEMGIIPPNVFTPGGADGFFGMDKEGLEGNNVFNIYTKNVGKYHLVVYDRWGVKVFESDQTYTDWNGRVYNTGQECPEGTYYYILEYRYIGKDKDEPIINGVVRIIKE